MRFKMPQIAGLLVIQVLMICLLHCIRGEEYTVKVSPKEVINDDGVCQKIVKVSGNGVVDEVPVRCDMVNYIIANDKQLVVGDEVYSDKAGTLIVLGLEECEKRTYENRILESTMKLSDSDCEDVKLMMMKAFIINDPEDDDWRLDVLDDDNNEGHIKAYDGIGQRVEDGVQPESEMLGPKGDDF